MNDMNTSGIARLIKGFGQQDGAIKISMILSCILRPEMKNTNQKKRTIN